MDDAMIARLLSTYDGAQPTVKNINAARQFFATNPEIAEKRAMGLRGSGVDDNSDIFGAQLEKFMQAAEAEAPPGRVEVGQPEVVAPPTQQAAPRQARAQMSNMPAQPGASRQSGYAPPVTRQTARPSGGFGLDDVLTALLGLSSTAGRAIMSGTGPDTPPKTKATPRTIGENGVPITEGTNPNTRAPAPYAEDTPTQRPTPTRKYENSTAVPLQETETPAQLEKMKAEVAAENEAAQRIQDQIIERNQAEKMKAKAQADTKKLANAGRKAVLGR